MLRRLKAVDDDIDAANAAIGQQDAAGAVRQIREAEDDKHRVVDLCPETFVVPKLPPNYS